MMKPKKKRRIFQRHVSQFARTFKANGYCEDLYLRVDETLEP